ncbi:SPOR domain-containing protein [Sulfurimonas sp.]
MDNKNELSDIVLNKNSTSNSNKKIILAIATLGVILIIVVMLMNSINSQGTSNLPQAVLPPEPQAQTTAENELDKEPLFKDVPIVQEKSTSEANLDEIAKKLKQESSETVVQSTPDLTVEKPKVIRERAKIQETPKVVKHETKQVHKVVHTTPKHAYFIQVGSFSRYEPNKKFLNSITNLGFTYSYRKIKSLNKVLVGPFKTAKEANKVKAILRSKVERGAFLVKF